MKSHHSSRSLRILGAMTGTSCDGLDASCLEFTPSGYKPLWQDTAAYPAALRKRVLDLQNPGARIALSDLLDLNRDLGSFYGSRLSALIQKWSKKSSHNKPHLIANHGQTVSHFPKHQTTLQLGDPSLIALKTQLTVISHFREGDLSGRGQGAPLLPRFHELLVRSLPSHSKYIAIHNIGGISNFSLFRNKKLILSFDTGPGNIWIDASTEIATRNRLHVDTGGALAKLAFQKNGVDSRALKRLLALPYFLKPMPKSTGRDDFSIQLLKNSCPHRDDRLIALATELTAESIFRSYQKCCDLKSLEIYICGGGSKNHFLLSRIKEKMPHTKISTLPDAQAIESMGFAYFGYRSLLGLPIGGPWTGLKSQDFISPGWITPGANWDWIRKKLPQLKLHFSGR